MASFTSSVFSAGPSRRQTKTTFPFWPARFTFDALLAAVPFILLLLIGLTHLAQALSGGPAVDPNRLFHRFFPPTPACPARTRSASSSGC